ncbi:endonuclease/exonuclease/phosphatase family protein [Streptomyces polyrhachis]|uniref:Endonuclease/exonuclease/phosphatase family protein n=1 Tax=Streptomyces polyrhachis TaxID=1282885 RepID=A0ABW2GIK1_9ACTN
MARVWGLWGRWGRWSCRAALAGAAALLVVRLAGLDAGSVLASVVVFLPYAGVLAAVVLGTVLAVPALRARGLAGVAGVVVVAYVVLLAPRFVADGREVPPGTPELRVATLNTDGSGADPRALVDLVRRERIDVLAVEQLPADGVAALERAGLGKLLPHQELHPEYDSSLYSRLPLSRAGVTRIDTAWPQTTAEVTVGGRRIRLVAVHTYYPLGDPQRWTRDLEALAGLAGPDTVLLGDFNASLDHTPMRALLAAGLRDAHTELGHGWPRTWPADHPLLPPLLPLDHVLHGPGLAALDTAEHTVAGTGHRAVVVGLGVVEG